jgi:hypothetical protein
MLDKIKKKIITIYKQVLNFFRTYLAQIVFVVFILQLLAYFHTLPYINLIAKYYYYVAAVIWILINVLFKIHITNKKILIVGLAMFVLGIPASLFDIEFINDNLGFVAFLFIFTYIIRQFFLERKSLKAEKV